MAGLARGMTLSLLLEVHRGLREVTFDWSHPCDMPGTSCFTSVPLIKKESGVLQPTGFLCSQHSAQWELISLINLFTCVLCSPRRIQVLGRWQPWKHLPD